MKLKDILLESPEDIVARFYKEASKSHDTFYNPEVAKYKSQTAEYYDKHFKEWFKEEAVPVFTKPIDEPQPAYTNKPKEDKMQSPGYRGLHYALAAAGLPYNRQVQRYNDDPNKLIARQTMDSVGNISQN